MRKTVENEGNKMKGIKKIGIYSNEGKVKIEDKYSFEVINVQEWKIDLLPLQLLDQAEEAPVKWKTRFWLYKGNIFVTTQKILRLEQVHLLILEEFDKEREYFERLMRKHSYGEDHQTYTRIRIPEAVRIEVWRRDGGKCAICGSRENLEYDHIIPVSKGGSNTARNIELLCEKHNRSKGAKIG